MIYRPPESEPMWDTWLYQNGEIYHLFFLALAEGRIGRASSKNLIDWDYLPPIENIAKKGGWNETGMNYTGCTVKHKDKYYMSFGSGEESPIGMLVSSDLMQWKQHPENPILPSKIPYKIGGCWRDLSAYYDANEECWHGYLYATHQSGVPSIAHLTTSDYEHWNYQEPVFLCDEFVHMEVPDYFEMRGKHYLLFSSVRSRKDTSGRKDAAGTSYVVSDHRDGPYHLPDAPLLLGSGRGRHDHYVGRTIKYNGKRLLYHHTWGATVITWATPKVVHQDENGNLMLKYWSDLDTLETRTLLQQDCISCEAQEGRQAVKLLDVKAADAMISFNIDISGAWCAGFFWRNKEVIQKELGKIESAVGLMFNKEADTVSVVNVKRTKLFNASTILCSLKDDYQQAGLMEKALHVRILVRAHMAEIYINEQWIFCLDISDAPKNGNMGVLVESGKVIISNLRIAKLKPLKIEKNVIC